MNIRNTPELRVEAESLFRVEDLGKIVADPEAHRQACALFLSVLIKEELQKKRKEEERETDEVIVDRATLLREGVSDEEFERLLYGSSREEALGMPPEDTTTSSD